MHSKKDDTDTLDDRFIAGLKDLDTVGRYKIVHKLGQGGNGVVYLGRDPYIKRDVAIKLSQPTTEKSRESFFIEAQSTGRISHPNIVDVHDAGIYNEYCYIAMEYVDGTTLDKFCKKDGLLPVNKVAEIIFQVCEALDYGHKKGIIHRDIKPSNIMLNKGGTPKITDFGIAQVGDKTMEMGVWGTPSYMAPELLKEEDISGQNDIFSLGCVLFEMLAGQKAFDGDNNFTIMYKITTEETPAVISVRPDVPKILDEITRKAMAKDKRERYQTCMDFAYDLRVAMRGLDQAVQPNGKPRDIYEFICHIPFFKDLTVDQVKELTSVTTIGKVPKGRVIMAQGDIDDTFYIILSGKARIRKAGKDVALVATGECFGEMAYIAGQPRVADVIAETECILMKISATLLDKASESLQLLFFRNFARTLVRRLSVGVQAS